MKRDLLKELNFSLRLGQESADNELTETEQYDNIDEGESATSQDIESTEVSEEVGQVEDVADTQIDDAESVDELVTATEHLKSLNKPLSRIEAAALTLAFHQVTKKHYKKPLDLLPAREAHQGTNVVDLNLVHESFKETAKDMYNKAIETIKMIIKKITEFVRGIIDKYGALERRFGNIHKAARTESYNEEGTAQALAGLFEMGGKADFVAINAIPELIMEMDKNHLFAESIADVNGREITEDQSSHAELFRRLSTKVRNDVDAVGDIKKNDGRAPSEVIEYSELPGNSYIGTVKVGETDLLAKKIGKLSAGKDDPEDIEFRDVGSHGGKGSKRGDNENQKRMVTIKVPNKGQVLQLSKNCFEAVKTFKVISNAEVRKLHNIRILEQVRQEAGGDEHLDSGEKAQIKTLVKYVTIQSNFLRDLSSWGYERMVGVASFLEGVIKNQSIDADSKEVPNEEKKEEAETA